MKGRGLHRPLVGGIGMTTLRVGHDCTLELVTFRLAQPADEEVTRIAITNWRDAAATSRRDVGADATG